MRKSYVLMLDTETANGRVDENGKLNLSDSQVYDCGLAVVDLYGNVYETHSYVIAETFYDREMMDSAYYARKLPTYWKDIWDGKRTVLSLLTLRKIIFDICDRWNVVAVCAHNARFDRNALDATIRYVTSSRVRYFLPYGLPVWDTLRMAHDVISPMKSYRKFCAEHGYLTNTKKPRPRETAEVLYRFISGDTNFDEAHTGLEDVLIETQILATCIRKHKKMRREI